MKIGSLFAAGSMLATLFMTSTVNAQAITQNTATSSSQSDVTKSNVYYISPTGSDSNPGTLNAPFKSLMKAQSVASPGDIVYILSGVYDDFNSSNVARTDNTYHYVNDFTKSGITYEAYPGDKSRPVFDFENVPTDRRVAAFFIEPHVTGLIFKGFDVIGVKAGNQKQSEAFNIRGNADFDNVAVHDTQANGFYFNDRGSGIAYDCDAYNNIGPNAHNAGNTDGFGGHGDGEAFINDRSWNNSDDGFDSINAHGPVIFWSDWSFNNQGNRDIGVGDQNGFKVGGYAYNTKVGKSVNDIPVQLPVHTVAYCLSADNGANGFYANHMPGQSANWMNNTAYNDGLHFPSSADFNMLERVSPTSTTNIPGYREVLHNNIAYMGHSLVANDNDPAQNETNNSWTINGGLNISSSDFVSLDISQLSAPRKPDGSLPDVTFMQPVPTSPLYGLGYLADKNDPVASLQQLVTIFTQYGKIDNHGIENSLEMKLENHDLSSFINEVEAQSGKHIDRDTAFVLILEAKALITDDVTNQDTH